MRILIAHNLYQVPGGEDAVARSEAELLQAFGEEVNLYQRRNAELNRLDLFKRLSHFSALGYNRASYLEMRELIRRHRPQVAHFHNIFYMMTPAVYQACRDEGVAVVQSLHNFRMMCSNGLFFRHGKVCEDCLTKNVWEGVRHGCFRKSVPMTLAMASTLDNQWRRGTWLRDIDLYIAAAEFTRKKYIQRGIPPEKIVLKPHFVYPEPKLQPQERRGNYALYLGRLSQEKGVDVMLNAWRALSDFPLKVVGTGPEEQKLKKAVSDEGMKNIEFTGFCGPQECEAHLRGAKFVIIPSVCYENFPRVVVEAFACGLPIIASRLGSLAELVEDGKTGILVEPGNASELSKKIRWCFENPMEIERMGHNARRVFGEKYSSRANYEKLMQIYNQAVNQLKERK